MHSIELPQDQGYAPDSEDYKVIPDDLDLMADDIPEQFGAASMPETSEDVGGPVAEESVAVGGLRARIADFADRHPVLTTVGGAVASVAAERVAGSIGQRAASDEGQSASPEGADLLARVSSKGAEYVRDNTESAAIRKSAGHAALGAAVRLGATIGADYLASRRSR